MVGLLLVLQEHQNEKMGDEIKEVTFQMFDDIMDANISVHPDIERAAIEWVEYELNRIYSKKDVLYVPSLKGEAERMLLWRLGKKWRYSKKINIAIDTDGNGGKEIKVKLRKWD